MVQNLPLFSIIVPTYNRPEQLAVVCLPALGRLNYPRERVQVVVVDDGSRMAIEPVVKSFQNTIDLCYIRQTRQGPARARNAGAARADGDFLAFTDDDCAPAPNWLARIGDHFCRNPDLLVGGRTINALSSNPYAVMTHILMDYLYDIYNQEPQKAAFFTSNNIALPKKHFNAIGGFETIFSVGGEDREFCGRWRHFGYPMIYDEDVTVYHAHHMTLHGFIRQHFLYGRGAHLYRRLISQLDQKKWGLEKPSFYTNLVRYCIKAFPEDKKLFFGFLLGLSQAATAWGYLAGPPRANTRHEDKSVS